MRNAEGGLSADQEFGDLDRVQGGAFAEIVGDDPQVDGAGVVEVGADAPHHYLIPAGPAKNE